VNHAGLPIAASPTDQHREAAKVLAQAGAAQHATLGTIAQWHDEITPLLNGEDGEAIAVNAELVKKLEFVIRRKRPTANEVSAFGDQVEALQDRVKELDGSLEFLSAREMYEIRRLRTDARQAQSAWERSLKQARAIVAKAKDDVQPKSNPTLAESLERLGSEETIQQIDDAMDGGEALVLEEDFPAETESGFSPEFQKKALSAEVTSALAPFLEPRNIQPTLAGRFSIKFVRTSEKQPMSLGKLMSIGALQDSELGRKKLALIGGNRKLPEPKWNIASQPNSWSEDDLDFLQESQQMLRDYGGVLIQEGLLSP